MEVTIDRTVAIAHCSLPTLRIGHFIDQLRRQHHGVDVTVTPAGGIRFDLSLASLTPELLSGVFGALLVIAAAHDEAAARASDARSSLFSA